MTRIRVANVDPDPGEPIHPSGTGTPVTIMVLSPTCMMTCFQYSGRFLAVTQSLLSALAQKPKPDEN
jgi:hypothetical protein